MIQSSRIRGLRVVGVGVGQQVPDDGQHRVAQRDDGAFLAQHPAGPHPAGHRRPGRHVVARTRLALALDLVEEIETIDQKIKESDRRLTALIKATGSRLRTLHGIGPSGAARLIGDIGGIRRFAAWNGTAPLDTSSGKQLRHRLSRAGNRRINRVLHIMAIVQLRHGTEGRR